MRCAFLRRSVFLCVAVVTAAAASDACPVLTSSGPVTVTSDGQIIENLDITTTDTTPGILCKGNKNVVIRNLRVTHYPQGKDATSVYNPPSPAPPSSAPSPPPPGDDKAPYSQGISFTSCDNITIENVRVQLVNFSSGPFLNFKNFNIFGYTSKSPIIRNVIVSGGSSGVWVGYSDKVSLSNWAAYNVHGPFPRGQCTQLSMCNGSTVENFICKNQWMYSWPEDAVSMWRSANSTVRNGVIAGSNAATGVGLMFEQSALLDNSWGLAQDIQVFGAGGCCFSTYGGTNIDFMNVSCRDNHCEGIDGRKAGSGLMFYAGYENPSNIADCCYSKSIRISGSRWYNSCRTPQLWQSSKNPNAFIEKDLSESDFTINEHPIDLELCFTIGGQELISSTATGENVGLVGDGSITYNSPVPYPRTPSQLAFV